ncbi:MAG: hypothetical protein WKF45_09470 [Ilumatobacteraceae bacterium]
MRLHITLEDELVEALDARLGSRERSRFIAAALRRALDDERRWDAIATAVAAPTAADHEWDADPAAWVREQRHHDIRRVG